VSTRDLDESRPAASPEPALGEERATKRMLPPDPEPSNIDFSAEAFGRISSPSLDLDAASEEDDAFDREEDELEGTSRPSGFMLRSGPRERTDEQLIRAVASIVQDAEQQLSESDEETRRFVRATRPRGGVQEVDPPITTRDDYCDALVRRYAP
jgi:hypothetical protein